MLREAPQRGADRDADDNIDQRILRPEGPSGPEDRAVGNGLQGCQCAPVLSGERHADQKDRRVPATVMSSGHPEVSRHNDNGCRRSDGRNPCEARVAAPRDRAVRRGDTGRRLRIGVHLVADRYRPSAIRVPPLAGLASGALPK